MTSTEPKNGDWLAGWYSWADDTAYIDNSHEKGLTTILSLDRNKIRNNNELLRTKTMHTCDRLVFRVNIGTAWCSLHVSVVIVDQSWSFTDLLINFDAAVDLVNEPKAREISNTRREKEERD